MRFLSILALIIAGFFASRAQGAGVAQAPGGPGLARSCSDYLRFLVDPSARAAEMSKTVLREWKEVDTAELLEAPADVPSQIALASGGPARRIIGKISRIEVIPGYPALRIESPNGKTQLFDFEKIQLEPRAYVATRPLRHEERIVANSQSIFDRSNLDYRRLRRYYCDLKEKTTTDPKLASLSRLVDRNLHLSGEWQRFLKLRCPVIALPAIFLAQYQNEIRNSQRGRGRGARSERTWLGEHGSNMTLGYAFLSLVHGCLGSMSTQGVQNLALTAVLGSLAAANAYSEVRIPGVNNLKRSDLGDFSSGAFSLITYLAVVKATEQAYRQAAVGLCRR